MVCPEIYEQNRPRMCGRLTLNGLYTVCTELNVNIRTFRDEKRPHEKRNSSQKRPHIMNFNIQNRTDIMGYPVYLLQVRHHAACVQLSVFHMRRSRGA